MPSLSAIPRVALDRTLQLWRLPLTTVETLLRRDADATPLALSVAFERLEAGSRELVGNALRDEQMLARARLQRLKVQQIEQAARLATAAERKQQEAEMTLAERQAATEERRAEVRRTAARQEADLEEERREKEAAAARKAADRKAKERELAEQRRKETQLREVDATRRELDAESVALAEQEQAVQAKGKALDLEAEAERTKARRKAAKVNGGT